MAQASPDATRAAAWKLIRFLASYESMIFWSRQTGELPMRTRVLQDTAFMEGSGKLRPFLDTRPGGHLSG